MKKTLRNIAIILSLGLGYLFAGNHISFNNVVVVITASIVLELMGELLGCFNELELQSRKSLSVEEIDELRNVRLVVKDTVLVYAVSYLLLTSPAVLVGYRQAIPFLVASIIPAIATAMISHAARIESKHAHTLEVAVNKAA